MSDSVGASDLARQRFEEIAEEQVEHEGVTVGMMFGGECLKLGAKVFGVLAHDRLVVKIPADRVNALVAAGEGERFDPGHGRPMREWLDTPMLSRDDDEDRWWALVDEARAFVGSLRGT